MVLIMMLEMIVIITVCNGNANLTYNKHNNNNHKESKSTSTYHQFQKERFYETLGKKSFPQGQQNNNFPINLITLHVILLPRQWTGQQTWVEISLMKEWHQTAITWHSDLVKKKKANWFTWYETLQSRILLFFLHRHQKQQKTTNNINTTFAYETLERVRSHEFQKTYVDEFPGVGCGARNIFSWSTSLPL